MDAIERANPPLKDGLSKNCAHEQFDKRRIGDPIDILSNVTPGSEQAKEQDVLGRVSEYFLS